MSKNITFNQLKKLVKESFDPYEIDQDFIDNLSRLTDGNHHAEAYKEVAIKCVEMCDGGSDTDVFEEFVKVLTAIERHEKQKAGSFDLRYAVEKELFAQIEYTFGKDACDRFNEGL